jgi:hypothetical protein
LKPAERKTFLSFSFLVRGVNARAGSLGQSRSSQHLCGSSQAMGAGELHPQWTEE